jgi:hypothetical protein
MPWWEFLGIVLVNAGTIGACGMQVYYTRRFKRATERIIASHRRRVAIHDTNGELL